jgi:hypothetical protein
MRSMHALSPLCLCGTKERTASASQHQHISIISSQHQHLRQGPGIARIASTSNLTLSLNAKQWAQAHQPRRATHNARRRRRRHAIRGHTEATSHKQAGARRMDDGRTTHTTHNTRRAQPATSTQGSAHTRRRNSRKPQASNGPYLSCYYMLSDVRCWMHATRDKTLDGP